MTTPQSRLAIAIALAGFTVTPAMAQKVEIPDLDVEVYGFINMAVMHADTGNGSEQFIVDNKYASSRVGSFITTPLYEGEAEVGAHIEYEYLHSASHKVTLTDKTQQGALNERQLHMFVKGAFGKVSAGKGSGAADTATESDLSGTKVASFPDLALAGGQMPFVDTSGNGADPTLLKSVRSQDFESRYDRLRYDTPTLGPVRMAVSRGYKDDEVNDDGGAQDITSVAAFFNHRGEGLGDLSASMGYSSKEENDSGKNDLDTIGGSISWHHPSGFNLTGVYSNADSDDGRDSDFTMIKPGYRQGRHAITVHRAEGDGFNPEVGDGSGPGVTLSGSEVTIHGMAYVYRPVERLEVFAAYNNFSLDSDVGDYEDVDIALLGSRLRF